MTNSIIEKLTNNLDTRQNLIELKSLLKDTSYLKELKNSDNYDLKVFTGLLSHEDAKVRKNSAIVLGILADQQACEPLFNAYTAEQQLFVRSSYLAAMSELDYSQYTSYLTNHRNELQNNIEADEKLKHISEEINMLNKMLSKDQQMMDHVFKTPAMPVRVMLTCDKSAVDITADRLSQLRSVSELKKLTGAIIMKTAAIIELMNIRTFREMLYPLNGLKPESNENLAKAITGGNLFPLLGLLHEDSDSPFRFRLDMRDGNSARTAKELESLSKGRLINSVSDYEIEIKARKNRDGLYTAFLELHTIKDKRFAYRKNYVAASIRPEKAAIIAELTKEYMVEDGQVLDPFCGVGTMLIERNSTVAASYMYGIDIYGQAIAGGRENSDIAGMNIFYINRNYFDFESEYLFDEIITNMPVIDRENGKDAFYRMFFNKSSEILKEQGIIIMYSNENDTVKKNLRIHGGYKLIREFKGVGSDDYCVYVIGRK